jgi:hypothetical protein
MSLKAEYEKWDRKTALESIRPRMWQYLSARAELHQIPGVVESLWRLPAGEMRRLTAAHLLLSPLTEAMLEAAERLLRRLPSTVSTARTELNGETRGFVEWNTTYVRRLATGDRTLFVCRPAERRYDTPLARVVRMALERCLALSALANLNSPVGAGAQIRDRTVSAQHLVRNPKLLEVLRVRQVPERVLASLQRERDAAPILAFLRMIRDALDDLEVSCVREVLEQQILSPAEDEVLFELLAGFAIVDALGRRGYTENSARLIGKSSIPFATLEQSNSRIAVWWQRSVWQFALTNAATSQFHRVLDLAAMSRSSLRPDFLILRENPTRVCLVEVKHTVRENVSGERDGIRDALAYLDDAREMFATLPLPHALVVAWNASGTAAPARVMVCGQNGIGAAMDVLLECWGRSSP